MEVVYNLAECLNFIRTALLYYIQLGRTYFNVRFLLERWSIPMLFINRWLFLLRFIFERSEATFISTNLARIILRSYKVYTHTNSQKQEWCSIAATSLILLLLFKNFHFSTIKFFTIMNFELYYYIHFALALQLN